MRIRFLLIAAAAITGVFAAACGSGDSPPATATATTPPATAEATQVSPTATPGGQNFIFVSSEKERVESPDVSGNDLEALVAGNTEFALDLYKQLGNDEDGNLFMSPYSISIALAMTYAGARGNTEQEMEDALRFTLPQDDLHAAFNALDQAISSRGQDVAGDDRFTLEVANSMWGQQGFGFEQDFLDTIAENYGAGMRLVDYVSATEAARQAINDWVEENTDGRIQDLIPPDALDDLTRLVLANAIFFKASWENQFNPDLTADGEFHTLDGSTVTAQMMSHDSRFAHVVGDDYSAVELPYVGGETSMVLLMPELGQFEAFEDSLTGDRLTEIIGSLNEGRLMLKMPKFEFGSKFSLPEQLEALGMRDAFIWQVADFSGMHTPPPDLYIKDVIHQSFVSVDETGTEASAATAVIIGEESLPPSLTVDRPFIFLIRDIETGTVLFMGRVLNPAAG